MALSVEAEGVRYGFLPRSHLAVSELRKAVGPSQPAIIHSHFTLYDETAILFRSVFCRKASVIWHFHATGNFTLAQRMPKDIRQGWGIRPVLHRYCFIAVGDGTFQYAVARGIPSSRLHLIQNGINTSRFRSVLRSPPEDSTASRDSRKSSCVFAVGLGTKEEKASIYLLRPRRNLQRIRITRMYSLLWVVTIEREPSRNSRTTQRLGRHFKSSPPEELFPDSWTQSTHSSRRRGPKDFRMPWLKLAAGRIVLTSTSPAFARPSVDPRAYGSFRTRIGWR